jgi:hypothetical protein
MQVSIELHTQLESMWLYFRTKFHMPSPKLSLVITDDVKAENNICIHLMWP